jgi:hypothetical protein
MKHKLSIMLLFLSFFLLPHSVARSENPPNASYSKDEKHHNNQKAGKDTHVFEGSRSFIRYTKTKKEALEATQNPQNKHWTPQTAGRNPSSETAQKKLGLLNKPKYVATIKAKDVQVLGKGHDKVSGGKRNTPEVVISKKPTVESSKVEKLKPKK